MPPMNRRALLKLATSAGLALPSLAAAQEAWPRQPIRMVCPFAAGGPTDVAARLVAEGLSGVLRQRVIVDNRTGSGVVVGTEAVAKAPKDGTTFLYSTVAHSVLRPLFANLSFDPVRDFRPVALVGLIPMLLMVNKDVPAGTLQELVALFRAEPGQYNYGSSGAGGAVHLATELFLRQAGGLKVNHVPYRGAAPAMPDLLNGSLTMFLNVASDGLDSARRQLDPPPPAAAGRTDLRGGGAARLRGLHLAHDPRAHRDAGGGRAQAQRERQRGDARGADRAAFRGDGGGAAFRHHARDRGAMAADGNGQMGAAGQGRGHHAELARSFRCMPIKRRGLPGMEGRARHWRCRRSRNERPQCPRDSRFPPTTVENRLDGMSASEQPVPPAEGPHWARSCRHRRW